MPQINKRGATTESRIFQRLVSNCDRFLNKLFSFLFYLIGKQWNQWTRREERTRCYSGKKSQSQIHSFLNSKKDGRKWSPRNKKLKNKRELFFFFIHSLRCDDFNFSVPSWQPSAVLYFEPVYIFRSSQPLSFFSPLPFSCPSATSRFDSVDVTSDTLICCCFLP